MLPRAPAGTALEGGPREVGAPDCPPPRTGGAVHEIGAGPLLLEGPSRCGLLPPLLWATCPRGAKFDMLTHVDG